MDELTTDDLRAAMACLERLYACTQLDALPREIVASVSDIVPAEVTAYTEVDPSNGKVVGFLDTDQWDIAQIQSILSKYIQQHPVIQHAAETGDGRAYKISDFTGDASFQETPLYHELFRPMGLKYQLSVSLPAEPPELIGLSLNRQQSDFTERDRLLLNWLRPHLLQIYRNAERSAALSRQITQANDLFDALPDGVIFLNPAAQVTFVSKSARRMLDAYFPGCRPGTLIPDELARWLSPPRSPRDPATLPPEPFRIEHGERRLTVQYLPAPNGRPFLLLKETSLAAPSIEALRRMGLTLREAEALHWVIEGKTNGEIAMILGISVRTIDKHLERVFRKLCVETRTAAIVKALQTVAENQK